MTSNVVCASPVHSTNDLKLRPEQDVCENVARFLPIGEGGVAQWWGYARGVRLFAMAPEDDLSGEFYAYGRKRGAFWLLGLVDGIFGGYSSSQTRQKIREFHLLELAENPSRLLELGHSGNS